MKKKNRYGCPIINLDIFQHLNLRSIQNKNIESTMHLIQGAAKIRILF